MNRHPAPRTAATGNELELPLRAVEDRLTALGLELREPDAAGVDRAAAELHTALALAIEHFARAARAGGVPAPLRRRLALAGGQVAAQREALARATASLDRAIDVLLPGLAAPGVYSADGAGRRAGSGSLLA
jgi:hypothetical protein